MRLSWLTPVLLLVGCGGSSTGADAGGSDPDAGVTDAGEVGDAGLDAGFDAGGGDGGAPFTAPAGTWTWVDAPESHCAGGTSTGVGVNLNPASTDVLVFLQGGGACGNGLSCWGPNPTALNLEGFGEAAFRLLMRRPSPLFDRANPANPFRELNYLYVPYCTGDMHSGTRDVDLALGDGGVRHTWFWGSRNLDLALSRAVATFPAAQRVYLVGVSAGGFGTVLMFDRVRRAWGNVRVDVIDDSGPSLLPKGGSTNSAFGVWGYELPSGCSPCVTHRDVLAFDRGAQPGSRYALMTYDQDSVLAPDFGYTLAEYPAVIDALVASFAGDANMAAFIVSGVQDHVVNGDAPLVPLYLPWLQQAVSDDPAWATLRVTHP